jgi:hypothetical protein
MAWSGRAQWGAGIAAVLAVAVAGAAWLGSRPGAPAIVAAPVAAAQSAVGGKKTASKPPEKTLWKDLSPAQQQALEPLAAEWDTDRTDPQAKMAGHRQALHVDEA